MEKLKDILKNPKVIGPILALVLGVALTQCSELKPLLQEVCAGVELKE